MSFSEGTSLAPHPFFLKSWVTDTPRQLDLEAKQTWMNSSPAFSSCGPWACDCASLNLPFLHHQQASLTAYSMPPSVPALGTNMVDKILTPFPPGVISTAVNKGNFAGRLEVLLLLM